MLWQHVSAVDHFGLHVPGVVASGDVLCDDSLARVEPLLKRLGIGRARLHAFRHTCASLLVEQGISMRIAQQQLGHSDPRITPAIYSHVIGDSHRQAVEKLSSVLDFCWPQLATNDDERKVKGQLIQ